MATVEELNKALSHINVQTGNPNAWRDGLSFPDQRRIAEWRDSHGGEVPDTLIGALRNQHPNLFTNTGALTFPAQGPTPPAAPPTAPPPDPTPPPGPAANPPAPHANGPTTTDPSLDSPKQPNGAPTPPQPPPPSSDNEAPQEGKAAEAIKKLESALKDQNSTVASADRSLAAAVLSAHSTSIEGKAKLATLQQSIEDAVNRQTALDTPMGAREFQKFLLSKQKEIIEVVATADLDDKSKAQILAGLTYLNAAPNPDDKSNSDGSKTDGGTGDKGNSGEGGSGAGGGAGGDAGAGGGDPGGAGSLDADGGDPLADLLGGDPGMLGGDPGLLNGGAGQMPQIPMPQMPSLGGGGGGLPGLLGGGGPGGGLGDLLKPKDSSGDSDKLDPLLDPLLGDDPGAGDKPEQPNLLDPKGEDKPGDKPGEENKNQEPVPGAPVPAPLAPPVPPGAGPTQVQLPNGQTVTAPNPQMAEVTKAIAGGQPIGESFRQHAGVNIAPPGAAVPNPLDPSQLRLGAVGQFTDHQVYALSKDLAVINGQIRPISEAAGPGFLGWMAPPDLPTAPLAPATTTQAPVAPAAAPGEPTPVPAAPAVAHSAPSATPNTLLTPTSK
ncbi:DUF4226 domain-containing protein [Mycobacterium sp. NPDC003449]